MISIKFLITAKKGELTVAEILIKNGANPNIGGEKTGWTPLQEAAKYGHDEFIKLLISKGANVNRPDFYGETALHTSVANGKRLEIQNE